MKNIIAIFLLFFSFSVLSQENPGCKIHGHDTLYHGGNIDKNLSFPYRLEGPNRSNQIPGTRIFNCAEAGRQRKLLLIGFGPIEYGHDANDLKVYYDGKLQEDFCSIKDTKFQSLNFSEREKYFEDKKNFNKHCLVRRVKHKSTRPLSYRPNQRNCTINKLDPQEAIVAGGTCFFRIFPDSEFILSYDINPNCLDKSYLKQNQLRSMEVTSYLTINTAANDTGNTDDFNLLGSKVVHARLDPLKGMTKLSELRIGKYPDFINTYFLPEHEVGKISIRKDEQNSYLKSHLFVNNICKKTLCEDGLCTSACDFQKPFVAKVNLFKIEQGSRPKFVKSWHEGGVAPPNWQGVLSTDYQKVKGHQFKEGEKYRLSFEMRDPKVDLAILNRELKPLFRALPGLPTGQFSSALLKGIPTIDDLQTLQDIPTISPLRGIDQKGNHRGNLSDDQGIQGISFFGHWPPYYKKVCETGSLKCGTVGNKNYLNYTVDFSILRFNEQTLEYELKDIILTKNSPEFGSSTRNVSTWPSIDCPWD
ncbi:MAG: hypothetical protein ACPGJV_06075 [Bacteriovoracaceae bacterium]